MGCNRPARKYRLSQKASPTLEDVARAAKVSTATISRSINEPDKVAKDTRQRIEKAIEHLGYTPNFGGRVLASNRSNIVGAVIPTMANAMFASGLQVFQEVLSQSSYNLLVASSGYNTETELQQIKSLVAQGADGLLLIGSTRPDDTTRFLKLRNIPYVIAWCYQNDSSRHFAGFNNTKAAAQIARAVLSKGHRQIAMIAGHATQNDRSANRITGVTETIVAQKNATLLSVVETDYTLDSGGDAFETIMNSHKLPSAVICGNDVLAAGAIVRARKLGIEIPREVSVTGFDDISLATVVSPALTTVRVPQLEMGRSAATLMLELLSNKNPKSRELQTEIVYRESLIELG